MQLVDDAAPVDVAGEETEDVTALEFAHDFDGDFVGRGRADDGGKAGHTAIDKLNAPGTQLNIVDGTVEIAARAVAVAPIRAVVGAGEARAARKLEAG